jgi:hypothetical protein
MKNIILFSSISAIALFGCGKSADDTSTTDTSGTTDTSDTGELREVESYAMTVSGFSVEDKTATISTREVVTISVEATYTDGTTGDVTDSSDFTSSDTALLHFYTSGVGQPLWNGSVDVTGSNGDWSETVTVDITMAIATEGDLSINEILVDGGAGDANGDGSTGTTTDSMYDEFIEITNASDVTIDISGAFISDSGQGVESPRHIFAEGTILQAGQAIVVFGDIADNADFSAFPSDNVSYAISNAVDPDLPHYLSFNNSGDIINVNGVDGALLAATYAYGEDGSNEALEDASAVLADEVYGTSYTNHRYAVDTVGDYSPGTMTDGMGFGGPDSVYSVDTSADDTGM